MLFSHSVFSFRTFQPELPVPAPPILGRQERNAGQSVQVNYTDQHSVVLIPFYKSSLMLYLTVQVNYTDQRSVVLLLFINCL